MTYRRVASDKPPHISNHRPYQHSKHTSSSRIHTTFPDEIAADKAIAVGDFDDAKDHLYHAMNSEQRHDRQTNALMKLITLPFAEIVFLTRRNQSVSRELIEDAESVHGHFGDLLGVLLMRLDEEGVEDRGRTVGNISKATILMLGARRFAQNKRSIIMPASVSEVYANLGYAADATAQRLDIPLATSTQLRLKTKRSFDHFSSTVKQVAIRDIQPRNLSISNKDSLPHRLIRETEGIDRDSDLFSINLAQNKLHRIIFGKTAIAND